jgi:hypothetical protein
MQVSTSVNCRQGIEASTRWLEQGDNIAVVSRIGKCFMSLAVLNCVLHFSFPVVPISITAVGICFSLGLTLYAVASFSQKRLTESDAQIKLQKKALVEVVKPIAQNSLTESDVNAVAHFFAPECTREQELAENIVASKIPGLLSKRDLNARCLVYLEQIVGQYVDALGSVGDKSLLARDRLIGWVDVLDIIYKSYLLLDILHDIYDKRKDCAVLELLSDPSLQVGKNLNAFRIDFYLNPKYWSLISKKGKNLLTQLRFFKQQPILYYLRNPLGLLGAEPGLPTLKKKSAVSHFFAMNAPVDVRSVAEDEYASLCDYCDELRYLDKKRAIKGLYGSIALKQLQGGFSALLENLKERYIDVLETVELIGREVFTEPHGLIQGCSKLQDQGPRSFYVIPGNKVDSNSSSEQAQQERALVLDTVTDQFISCLDESEPWEKHFILDLHEKGIGNKDFPNFNSQYNCEFNEIDCFKERFNTYVESKHSKYLIQWDEVCRNNFQSTAAAVFNGNPKCREHQDHCFEHWISICYMVTSDNYASDKHGMGVYVTQKKSEHDDIGSKHTSVMGDNQFLIFPSTALHGTDLGHEPDFETPIKKSARRLVANFRCELCHKLGGEAVQGDEAMEAVAEILAGFYAETTGDGAH